MSKPNVLGYAYKLESESYEQAIAHYGPELSGLSKTKEEVESQIHYDFKNGIIHNPREPEIFQVLAQAVEDPAVTE